MRHAVFDLDGTLIGGPSSERRFAPWLLRRRAIGVPQLLAWLGVAALGLPRLGPAVLRKDKGHVAGLAPERLAALARRFVDEELVGRLEPAPLAELERHRARGDTLVLLSGTLQPIAEALAERLGMDRAIGTLVPVRDGAHVAGLPLRHPFGVEKLTLVEALCATDGTTLADVCAYGDSIHDLALLERVGVPVAVAPDARLARVALARRWRVLGHRRALAKPPFSVHAR